MIGPLDLSQNHSGKTRLGEWVSNLSLVGKTSIVRVDLIDQVFPNTHLYFPRDQPAYVSHIYAASRRAALINTGLEAWDTELQACAAPVRTPAAPHFSPRGELFHTLTQILRKL